MKKFIAITILIGFLGSTTELHELLKLPHLIYHYFEHKSESHDLSLANFLHIHYEHDDDNHHDEDHDNDCLPFQGSHSCQSLGLFVFYFESAGNLNLAPQVSNTNKHYPVSESLKSNYSSNIWQPPKIG